MLKNLGTQSIVIPGTESLVTLSSTHVILLYSQGQCGFQERGGSRQILLVIIACFGTGGMLKQKYGDSCRAKIRECKYN